jgi:hypothetical protein
MAIAKHNCETLVNFEPKYHCQYHVLSSDRILFKKVLGFSEKQTFENSWFNILVFKNTVMWYKVWIQTTN